MKLWIWIAVLAMVVGCSDPDDSGTNNDVNNGGNNNGANNGANNGVNNGVNNGANNGDDRCGDAVCDPGEGTSCPQDCPVGPECGDGTCDEVENFELCPEDCEEPGPECGNGECEEGEDTASCEADCPPEPICQAGQTRCVNELTVETCSEDGLAWGAAPCDVGWVCVTDAQECLEVICQPNTPQSCLSSTIRIVCDGTGTGTDQEDCPQATRCFDGECNAGEGLCASDDECANDTYCDGGVCLPYPTGPRGDTNESCLQAPFEGAFSPEVQCRWDQGNVIMQPAVIDLDGDEVPEIIFTYWPSGGGGNGRVIAIRGDDCTEVSQTDPQYNIEIQSSIAVGDIDGDGLPEIVTHGRDRHVRAFDHNLVLQWDSPHVENVGWGGPALADIDGDGDVEIVFGATVLNGIDGSLAWQGQNYQYYSIGPLTAVADVNNDGEQEIVLGNRIYSAAGVDITPDGMRNLTPGHVAIADFDPETLEPEIAVVANGSTVRIQRLDGSVLFGPFPIPGATRNGGAPNVGDFDGDGQPEIGTAAGSFYAVFDMECDVQPVPEHCAQQGIRWLKPTRDRSSGVTGSSLFDFEGDNSVEVVYNDECFMRVYDGATGTVRFAFPNTTNTTYENPVVADVDGDFNSEIVIPANDLPNCVPGADTDPDTGTLPSETRGVLVLRDVTDRWVNSRPIWNQHTYHITNINDDGTIPAREEQNWHRFNNYRQNIQNDGKALYAPDMTVDNDTEIPRPGCGALELRATVHNRGSQPVSRGVPVSFFTADPDEGGQHICTATTTMRLDPAAGEEVGCTWTDAPDAATDIYIVADVLWEDGMAVNRNTECFELNNWAVVTVDACQ